MFNMSGRAMAIRATMLAGAAALGLGGLTASARAFPVAMPAPALGQAETIQSEGDGYRHHGPYHRYHDRYGVNAHPRHPGHAGLYDCGPGGKNTRLSRRACSGNNRFQHLQQSY